MNKKIIKKLKINKIEGCKATPSPPIGPVLGSAGINIMDFCKKFNLKTKEKKGKICPVIITVYEDKSFDFLIKNPPVTVQLLELTKLKKGSKEPNKIKIAKISFEEVKIIAENKISDMNCNSIEAAISMIVGTAKSMGIQVC
ncbi:MAG: 50S ribosomal protein L11 [Candidatus Bostrichicola ureolyticus]|nr:MAG: 50S ribosomal protein L11 [Candidatus Bostrichicola ureolyticus]